MTIHLIHMPVQPRAFGAWSARRGLRDDESASHALVTGIFGRGVLQPYRLVMNDHGGDLYGYAAEGAEALRQLAQVTATPDMESALDLSALRSKTMPELEEGARVGFDLRFRPVRRRDGAECDAHVVDQKHGRERTRDESYMRWLSERLENSAELESFRLVAFSQVRTLRKERRITAPLATAQGTLRVTNAAGFADLLKRGVGRHGSYGLGMLLLRPADRE